jgi:hypothetical protein
VRKLFITLALAGTVTAASLGLSSSPAQAVGCVWVNQMGTVWYPEEGDTVLHWDGATYHEIECRGGTMYDMGSVEEERLIAEEGDVAEIAE